MFGWGFRTTAIDQLDSTVVSAVSIDTATGMLRWDGRFIRHINNGVPLLPILSDEQQQQHQQQQS